MKPKIWAAVACALIGAPLAAYGLANGSLLLAIGGLALVLTFVFLVVESIAVANKPKHEIPKSADAAWNMKDRPVVPPPVDERKS
ncbi:MAG: hypothetical protein ACREBN_07545 [Burkholderiaceae bacterium]